MNEGLKLAVEWQQPLLFPWLQENEIHVWRFETPPSDFRYDKLYGLLSRDEKKRAHRMRFEKDRREFVMARGALRMILGGYLQRAPRQVLFSENDYGKPELINGKRIAFNVSHSHGLVLLAFAKACSLGIDVERVLDLEYSKMAERFFAHSESEKLFSLPEQERLQAFYICWTRKEAFVKAMGDGLTYPLDQFQVTFSFDEPADIIGMRDNENNWHIWDLSELPGYAAALVSNREDPVIKYWQWQYCMKHQVKRLL